MIAGLYVPLRSQNGYGRLARVTAAGETHVLGTEEQHRNGANQPSPAPSEQPHLRSLLLRGSAPPSCERPSPRRPMSGPLGTTRPSPPPPHTLTRGSRSDNDCRPRRQRSGRDQSPQTRRPWVTSAAAAMASGHPQFVGAPGSIDDQNRMIWVSPEHAPPRGASRRISRAAMEGSAHNCCAHFAWPA